MSLKRGVNGNIKSLLILIKLLGLRQQQTFKIRIVGEREREISPANIQSWAVTMNTLRAWRRSFQGNFLQCAIIDYCK